MARFLSLSNLWLNTLCCRPWNAPCPDTSTSSWTFPSSSRPGSWSHTCTRHTDINLLFTIYFIHSSLFFFLIYFSGNYLFIYKLWLNILLTKCTKLWFKSVFDWFAAKWFLLVKRFTTFPRTSGTLTQLTICPRVQVLYLCIVLWGDRGDLRGGPAVAAAHGAAASLGAGEQTHDRRSGTKLGIKHSIF